jgi:hypothetical protein
MRLFPLLICAVSISATVWAQKVDTLFYGDSPRLYKNPYGWGYVAGTNHYNDIGKYQRFDLLDGADIVGTKIFMAMKRIVGTPDSITIVFKRTGYGADNFDPKQGGPGKTVASIKTTTAAFDTTKKGSVFMLSTPFRVNGELFSPDSIFIGIEWQTTGNDTFALAVDDTTIAPRGEKSDRAWEQLTGAAYKYQRFNEPGDFSWLLDGDIWIACLYKVSTTAVERNRNASPRGELLLSNYPNPFNPSTTFELNVPEGSMVRMSVFDVIGRERERLIDERLERGAYSVRWRASDLPSGMYICRATVGTNTINRQIMLLK